MLKIGLTGGIGSGKTTIAKMFETLGTPVYYADIKAKGLMRSNKELKIKIKKLLGLEAYYTNGYPNRAYIAKKVFSNKTLLLQLNAIVHPAVRDDLTIWFDKHKNNSYCLYESAILFESNTYKLLDKIIAVTAPIDIRIDRVIKRDKTSKELIQKRVNNQMSDKERNNRSDYTIHNGSKDMLIPQIYNLHQILNELVIK